MRSQARCPAADGALRSPGAACSTAWHARPPEISPCFANPISRGVSPNRHRERRRCRIPGKSNCHVDGIPHPSSRRIKYRISAAGPQWPLPRCRRDRVKPAANAQVAARRTADNAARSGENSRLAAALNH